MKKLILISISLFCVITTSAQFETYSKKTKIYSAPVSFDKLEAKETISVKEYNDIFVNYKFGEQYYFDVNGEYDDDDVARYVAETSGSSNAYSEQSETVFYNKVYILGKLDLSTEYETFIFKIEQYRHEYILLNNYTKSGKLLSAICLFFTEKWDSDIIYSSFTDENEIIQNTVTETVDMEVLQKTFVLGDDGHFRVIKSIIE